ncbi:S-adenosyl-L-methionine-dependent methyltransferase [Phlegmacium glaucopus]|nr:S-adenosyl-L-methionine-dependent methyltransferase [Phlegmacium glaucopus]
MSTSDLQPSKLGTKEHWDSVYQEELANFEEIGDEGEIWFGAETINKMVEWSLENIPPSSSASVLEIGSGNGTLLFGLLDAGYDPARLSGIDYSPGAVVLSSQIAQTRGGSMISFSECDFLKDDPPLPGIYRLAFRIDVWDLILDKGTYDAIALGQKDDQGRSPSVNYPDRAARLLKPGGYFLITSCNFTEDELKSNFATPETGLTYHSRIQHPTYTFGGKSGSICSSVAFKKCIP